MDQTAELISLIREKDTFAKHLGIELIEAGSGSSHATMPLGPNTANALGNVHGGAYFALADLAFAAASNSEGVLSVAVQVSIQYMAPCPSEGRLHAHARKMRETRRLGFYQIDITTPAGETVASVQAVAYRKGGAIPSPETGK